MALVAILSFVLGGMVFWVVPTFIQASKGPPAMQQPEMDLSFQKLMQDPKYSLILQKEIATPLHLTPSQITAQLNEGKSMTDIAAAQGVFASQLQDIELTAFHDFFNSAVNSGDSNPKQADQWTRQLQDNPGLLDKMTFMAFTIGSKGR